MRSKLGSKTRPVALLILVIMAGSAVAFRQVEAHNGVSLSGFTTTPPTLDGNIQAAEWAAAGKITFGPLPFWPGQTITGTTYMMNDAVNLYIAVSIDGDDDFSSQDGFEVFFDNNHVGGTGFAVGDDLVEVQGASGFFDNFFQSPYHILDVNLGGTSDGQAAGGRQGSSNHFELWHPLDSADDAHDFSLSPGQTVGFGVMVTVDGTRFPYDCQWSHPDTYADYVVAAPPPPLPLSSVRGSVIEAAAGSVYMVYPDYDSSHVKPNGAGAAALSDFTALGFVYGMTVNTQVNALDTSPTYVTQSNGKPLVSGRGIVLVGGQAVHACVRYYENQRIAPVYPQVEGTMYYWYTKSGVKLTSTGMDSKLFGNGISYHQDMFVVEYFVDGSGNAVFVIYGYGWKGSFAGGEYFKSIIYPNIGTYTHAYYIYQWVDANNDGFPDLNEITPVTNGD